MLEHEDVKSIGELLNVAWAAHEMTGEHASKVIHFLISDPHETHPIAAPENVADNSTEFQKVGTGLPNAGVKDGDLVDASIRAQRTPISPYHRRKAHPPARPSEELVDGNVEVVSEGEF